VREWKRLLASRLDALNLSPARQSEIVDELSQHLDDRARELVAGGMDETTAEHTTMAEISDDDLLVRRMRGLRQAHVVEPPVPGATRGRWWFDLWQDLRYGARSLRSQPGFTAAAVLTLALGIGANTAIFSLVNAVLLRPLPVADPASLMYIANGPIGGEVFSYPATVDLRAGNTVFSGVAVWGPITASVNAESETDQVPGLIVSGNLFELLGIQAAAGRVLSPADDEKPGAHPVAVISHGFWQRRFGGRDGVVGADVLINGHRFTIVGILPVGFRSPDGGSRDLFVPMMMQAIARPPRAGFAGEMNPDLLNVRGNSWIYAIGRLKPGETREKADASLTGLMTSLDREREPAAREHRVTTWPLLDGVPGSRAQVVPVATLLLCIVGAVLLIACANVANLLLSRGASRRREVAVRLAIGASRWRLIRQFLTESVLLASIGGALGVALAWAIARGFAAAPPPGGALPVTLQFALDLRVLFATLGLSVLTGLLFGLAPALSASRPTLVPALKDDSFVPDERRRHFNLRKGLVVAEVALSLLLLVAAGLFVRSLRETQAIAPGFDADRLLNAPLNINLLRYTTTQGREFYQRVVDRVEQLPGVEAASVARVQVMGGGRVSSLTIEGREPTANVFQSTNQGLTAGQSRTSVNSNVVGPGYFKTLGLRLVRGREFDATDAPGSTPVVVVNQAFVALHLAGEEGLGKRISFRGTAGPWHTIVGVVTDSKYSSLAEPFAPIAYQPLSQNHETGMTLHVRTSVPPDTMIPAVRREIQAIEPNLPLPNVRSMADTIGVSLYAARMGAWLISVLGGLALLLASIGVYGVLAFSLARRTRELGIRQALGADRGDIFALVLREGLWLVVIGIAIGLGGAAFGAQPLAQFLYGVGTRDPITFVVSPIVLILIALVACLVPARRATRVDPTVALRS
jgi:predicted permease